MKLYFVRHGESQANTLHEISNRGFKHGLTERGIRQAERLAKNLTGISFYKIYTSPLKRAFQTAEIVSKHLNFPFERHDALREFDCGQLEGRSDPKSWKIHKSIVQQWLAGNWHARIPGGESHLDIQDRFIPFVEGLMQSCADETFLLVGHGGLFVSMLPLIFTNIAFDFPRLFEIDYTSPIIAEKRAGGLFCTQWGKDDLSTYHFG